MESPQQLPLETQFAIARFNATADKMSREQAIDLLKDLYLSYESQRELYKQLLKKEWGIGEHEFNQRATGEEQPGK